MLPAAALKTDPRPMFVPVSLSEFLAKSDEYVYKLADNLLDAMTNGEHSKSLKETAPVSTYFTSSLRC